MMTNKHLGSSFDDFLEEEGLLAETSHSALERLFNSKNSSITSHTFTRMPNVTPKIGPLAPLGERVRVRGKNMKPIIRERTKKLRKSQTDAERYLWQHLRNRSILNCKFRRQYAFGKYIVDFVCLEKKLIVELDGGQHLENATYDKTRTKYLNEQGFQVIRFWNNDVLQNIKAVLEKIYLDLF